MELTTRMSDSAAMAAAMQRMWTQFRPQVDERVEVLEAASVALAAGTLTEEHCQAAAIAAHTLAGTLGTFGLNEGTVLARTAEPVFSDGLPIDADQSAKVAEIAAALRAMIANKV
ncbi:MAG TPA: Hpt domain-containing protein [Terracidiphilus sp.]|nr:Hpt domain-containing protein [Terracidiphilus sp.]